MNASRFTLCGLLALAVANAMAKPFPFAQVAKKSIKQATKALGKPSVKGNESGSPYRFKWAGTQSVDLYSFSGKVLILDFRFPSAGTVESAFKTLGLSLDGAAERPDYLRNDNMSYVKVKGAPAGWIVSLYTEKDGRLLVQVADPTAP